MANWIIFSTAAGLQSRVESLLRKSNSEFTVCLQFPFSSIEEKFAKTVVLSCCSNMTRHILNFFSGSYITDEWTRPCITISCIYCWKGEDKAVPRMDHKGQRNLFNLHAGNLEHVNVIVTLFTLWLFLWLYWSFFLSSLNGLVTFQLCGVRGNANVPAMALFWQLRKGLTFLLTFESEQERNAAIVLARKYADDCNVSKTYQEKIHFLILILSSLVLHFPFKIQLLH